MLTEHPLKLNTGGVIFAVAENCWLNRIESAEINILEGILGMELVPFSTFDRRSCCWLDILLYDRTPVASSFHD